MITVEDLLMAYASAYDAWLDPEAERKNPTPEYAELIRQVVSFENEKLRDQLEEQKCFAADLERDVRALRELVLDMWPHVRHRSRMCGECELSCDTSDECLLYEPMRQRMRELGVEVGE